MITISALKLYCNKPNKFPHEQKSLKSLESNPTHCVLSPISDFDHPILAQVHHVLVQSHEPAGEVVLHGVLQVPGQVEGQNLG